MAKLYELTGAYATLLELSPDYIDTETGEIQSEFAAALDSIGDAIDVKIEGCAKIVRSIDSDMEAVRAEEVRLAKRRKALEASGDRLRDYMRQNMLIAKREKIKTAFFTVYLSKARDKVIIDNEELIADEYRSEKKPPPSKTKLLDAILEGKVVAGAHVVSEQPLTIK